MSVIYSDTGSLLSTRKLRVALFVFILKLTERSQEEEWSSANAQINATCNRGIKNTSQSKAGAFSLTF